MSLRTFMRNTSLQKYDIGCFQDPWDAQSEFSNELFYHYFLELDSSKIQSQSYLKNTQKQSIYQSPKLIITPKGQLSSCIIDQETENRTLSDSNVAEIDNIQKFINDNSMSNFNSTTFRSDSSVKDNDRIQNLLKQKRKQRKIVKKCKQFKHKNDDTNEKKSQNNFHNKQTLKSKRSIKSRTGKHNQSKTQKFIYFMTQYHYSKNFNQYFRKRIIQHVGAYRNYSNSNSTEKTQLINQIICELESYSMSIHYNVEKSAFFQNFSHLQQKLIKSLFHLVIRKIYKLKLEIEKKHLESNETNTTSEQMKFFDEKGNRNSTQFSNRFYNSPSFSHHSQTVILSFVYRKLSVLRIAYDILIVLFCFNSLSQYCSLNLG